MIDPNDKIEKVIMALLSCPRVEDAARLCGVSRTTLWRIMKDATFKHRMREARGRLSEQVVISLQAVTLDAVNTLRSVMVNKRTPTSVRVTAAGKLIDLSLRAKQQLDLEQRIQAVELALRPQSGKKTR